MALYLLFLLLPPGDEASRDAVLHALKRPASPAVPAPARSGYADVRAAVARGECLIVFAGVRRPACAPALRAGCLAVEIDAFPGEPPGVYRCFLRDGHPHYERHDPFPPGAGAPSTPPAPSRPTTRGTPVRGAAPPSSPSPAADPFRDRTFIGAPPVAPFGGIMTAAPNCTT